MSQSWNELILPAKSTYEIHDDCYPKIWLTFILMCPPRGQSSVALRAISVFGSMIIYN